MEVCRRTGNDEKKRGIAIGRQSTILVVQQCERQKWCTDCVDAAGEGASKGKGKERRCVQAAEYRWDAARCAETLSVTVRVGHGSTRGYPKVDPDPDPAIPYPTDPRASNPHGSPAGAEVPAVPSNPSGIPAASVQSSRGRGKCTSRSQVTGPSSSCCIRPKATDRSQAPIGRKPAGLPVRVHGMATGRKFQPVPGPGRPSGTNPYPDPIPVSNPRRVKQPESGTESANSCGGGFTSTRRD
ncbi:hypothetical protein C8J57DRAFT_1247115 [Mycena rebaudengoi]|nr:hypothetical protein C8J57DRAFT_1247115 [Mycena rebaudengoi]